jgi:hypothetical protein
MTSAPEPYPDVLVLGAGFSKAASAAMPLTDDLGNEVVADLRDVVHDRRLLLDFHGGQFEAWLSRLAEEQPDLTNAENLANQHVFALCSQLLADRLDQHVAAAREDPDGQLQNPDQSWLPALLGTLHARQATVITFNQDVLVELAVRAAQLHCWDGRRWPSTGAQPEVRWWDLLAGHPPLPAGRYGARGVPHLTFRLLKLHGSTNWYWTPGDTTGGSVACWFLEDDLLPEQVIPDEVSARERELPGRVPLIVPPAAGKSTYYRSPALAQLWQNARKALIQPEAHVSIVGYSLPLTDLTTAGMLRETLGPDRPNILSRLEVVNPDAASVLRNLNAIGAQRSDIAVIDSVAAFAQQYQDRAAQDVVTLLREGRHSGDRYLMAGTSLAGARKVVRIDTSQPDVVSLVLEDSDPPHTGTNLGPDGAPPPLPLDDLKEVLGCFGPITAQPATATSIVRIEVIAPGGGRLPVVAMAEHGMNWGAGNGRWLVLITPLPVM